MLRRACGRIPIGILILTCIVLMQGHSTPAHAEDPIPSILDWRMDAPDTVRFHLQWRNQDPSVPSDPVAGVMSSQEFGVFMPNHGTIGSFDVPPIPPDSFFDVFFDVPLVDLPPTALERLPNQKTGPSAALADTLCTPDDHWDGNVDVTWQTGAGTTAQVNAHYGTLQVCPGAGNSYIHVAALLCGSTLGTLWSLADVCPGFNVTLVNEDFSPAPAVLPAGWSGWICVNADAAVPVGTECCLRVLFDCDGVPAEVLLCVTTCDWAPTPPDPVVSVVDWVTNAAAETVRFQLHWRNLDLTSESAPVQGMLSSQEFGVFMPNHGTIGSFDVPPIPPDSFFDVFFDVPLVDLPPTALERLPNQKTGPSAALADTLCTPDDHWDGNVDVVWQTGTGNSGQVNAHYGTLQVCPGAGNSYIHVAALLCGSTLGTLWSLADVCSGFNVTLVNEDFSPAPVVLPAGWSGWICVNADATVPVGTECCLRVLFDCDGVPAEVLLCVTTCDWAPTPPDPVVSVVDWVTDPAAGTVHFQLHWQNLDPTSESAPVQGMLSSQGFGVFMPNHSPIGSFDVPPIPPDSFFDVFFDVPLPELPPTALEKLPTRKAAPAETLVDTLCTPDDHWDGNVDVVWQTGTGNAGQVNVHYGTLQVFPGAGKSYIHVAALLCGSPNGVTWSIQNVCQGFSATLVNEDFTPAPAVLPAGWTGWICISAGAAVPLGQECCMRVVFDCDGAPAAISLCVSTCGWAPVGAPPVDVTSAFMLQVSPNPATVSAALQYAVPRAGYARVEIYDAAGRLIRTLLAGPVEAGSGLVNWDRRDGRGEFVPAGVYFARLSLAKKVAIQKVLIVR